MVDKKIRIILDSRGARRDAESLNQSMQDVGKSADSAQFSVKKLAGAISGIIAASQLASFFQDSIRVTRDFDKSLSELSAITGATGDDLKFLGDAAKEFGATTTLSASQAVEALKLIASAKPDLLENAEALKQVTREAIALAEAAGIDLPAAANTLGVSLNQFGADAEEAGRFINVLAAGAKFGSSEIADTAEALKNAGVSASAASISFEETNAAIQLLATSGLKGAEAGTGLRNVLSILDTNIKTQFRPSVVGLEQALRNVNDANLDATEFVKLFGRENQNAARILLNQVDNLGSLTRSLTDTQTAYEQASINTNNLDGDIKALSSSYESLQLAVGSVFTQEARSSTQALTVAVKSLAENMDTIVNVVQALSVIVGTRLAVALAASATAFLYQQASALKSTITMNAMGQVIARTTVATNALALASRAASASMALLGGPIGILAIAATSLIYFSSQAEGAAKATDILTRSVENLTEAQVAREILETSKALEEQNSQLKEIVLSINRLEYNNQNLYKNDEEGLRRNNELLIREKANLDDVFSSATKLKDRLELLNRIREEGNAAIDPTANYTLGGDDPFADPSETRTRTPAATVTKSDVGQQEIAQAQSITQQLQNELNLRLQIADIYRQKTLADDASLYEQQLAAIQARQAEDLANLQARAAEDQIRRDEQFRQALENDKIKNDERAALREEQINQEILAEQILQAGITSVRAQGQKARDELDKAEFQARLASAGALGQALLNYGQGQSKKLFKIGQGLALAQAAVALPSAVLQSFQNGGGYPWGLIPAAAMALEGAKQIQNIKKAGSGIGGGSGGSVPTISVGGGGSASSPTIPSTAQSPELNQQRRIIDLRGVRADDRISVAAFAALLEEDGAIVTLESAREDAARRNVIGVSAR